MDLQCTCKSVGQVYLQKCEGCNFMVYNICTYYAWNTWFGLVSIFLKQCILMFKLAMPSHIDNSIVLQYMFFEPETKLGKRQKQ